VLLIPAGNPSAWTGPTGNNTYLLNGAVPTLIDAGVGEPSHLAAVEEGLAGRDLAQILITHNHSDHIKGIPALRERWPAVAVRNLPDAPLRDGEPIEAGDGVLRALHTPGHAPDHFCFAEEAAGDVYCGDLARTGGTIVVPASTGGDLVAYLASLRRIRDLHPRRLLPGHGAIIDDPAAVIEAYLEHRRAREEQILAVLRNGPASPEEIAAGIYGSLGQPLARAAADSVLAHLRKLDGEGRAAADDAGRWRLS
jgi:glyoxylase-like metal-dependent hydrolase (beta-lactamase superfamily II)